VDLEFFSILWIFDLRNVAIGEHIGVI
jgi:hypothetical protein